MLGSFGSFVMLAEFAPLVANLGAGGRGDGGGGGNSNVSRKWAALKKNRSKQKRTGGKVARKLFLHKGNYLSTLLIVF